ncbi:ABC transporter ATP-binding protein (plasmid) [Haloferax sp. S1W]|uniref:ABC transporter ATP-binding protein n=1 Tax=Haloferax sp. S1W TaxID=3377110 RepID=UPI0037C8DA02
MSIERTDTAGHPVLRGTDIVTGYGRHEVIHNVSVRSHTGVTCIFGPNGSGKSTLMKALSGALPVWSGTVHYGDEDLTNVRIVEVFRHGIVQLPQDGGLFNSLSVHENLRIGGHFIDDPEELSERISTVYRRFPALEEKSESRAGSLSGGQQMMLGLGRAMIAQPSMYLLDEPSAGLSPTLVDDVFDMIRDLVDDGAHVILIEQNVRAALRVADHVYVLAQGKTQFDGTPDELSEEPELLQLYLGIKQSQ